MWNYIDVFSGTISRKLQLFRVANKVMSTFKRPYYNIESVWGGGTGSHSAIQLLNI